MTDKITEDRAQLLASMYGEEDVGPQEQPIQLRLAGKATIVTIDGKQIPIPRMEYVEAMEAGLRALKAENEDLRARLRKAELILHRNNNIASGKMRTLESELRSEIEKKVTRRDY